MCRLPAERRSPQPQLAQVLRACGEREGGGVDGGRDGVPETQVAEDHRVRIGLCTLLLFTFISPFFFFFF